MTTNHTHRTATQKGTTMTDSTTRTLTPQQVHNAALALVGQVIKNDAEPNTQYRYGVLAGMCAMADTLGLPAGALRVTDAVRAGVATLGQVASPSADALANDLAHRLGWDQPQQTVASSLPVAVYNRYRGISAPHGLATVVDAHPEWKTHLYNDSDATPDRGRWQWGTMLLQVSKGEVAGIVAHDVKALAAHSADALRLADALRGQPDVWLRFVKPADWPTGDTHALEQAYALLAERTVHTTSPEN